MNCKQNVGHMVEIFPFLAISIAYLENVRPRQKTPESNSCTAAILMTYKKTAEEYDRRIQVYILVTNHVHLLATPKVDYGDQKAMCVFR